MQGSRVEGVGRVRPQRPRGRRPGPIGDPWLDELEVGECLDLLRLAKVGRISVLVDGFPVILPVNHLVVDGSDGPRLVVRTRSGTVIDRDADAAAFQVDSIDVHRQQGWSVLVRGTLRHPDEDEEVVTGVELESWLAGRDTWLVIVPVTISGRRLHASDTEWPFHPHGYL